MLQTLIIIAFFLVTISTAIGEKSLFSRVPKGVKEVVDNRAQRLVRAYPAYLERVENNFLIWKDGTKMVFDDGKTPATYLQLLETADLAEQLATPYPLGQQTTPPEQNEDPGRVRNEAFFKKMYGNSAAAVAKNLTTVNWFGSKLKVTKINGVDVQLRAIAAELAALPSFKKYLTKPGGTFKWRLIAQTNRLSMHSFGIAIDINTGFTNYWQWVAKGKKVQEGAAGIIYKNKIPYEIVEIFEKHGFIWGGKWYHYDTMHFEYRPELL